MDKVFPQGHFEVTIFSKESKLTNATVIRLVETKLDNTVLISETEVEEYDLVRSDRSQRGGGVTCLLKLYFI